MKTIGLNLGLAGAVGGAILAAPAVRSAEDVKARTAIGFLASFGVHGFDEETSSLVDSSLYRTPIAADPETAAWAERVAERTLRETPAIAELARRWRSGRRPPGLEDDVATAIIQQGKTLAEGEERAYLLAMARLFRAGTDGVRDSIFSEGGVRHLAEVNRLTREIDEEHRMLDLARSLRERPRAMEEATALWKRTYKLGLGDDGAMDEGIRAAARWRDEHVRATDLQSGSVGESTPGQIEGARLRLAVHYAFLARWADAAFPILQTSHTYAAALACTDVYPEVAAYARAPWPALRVELPVGLVSMRADLVKALEERGESADAVDLASIEGRRAEITHVDLLVLDSGPACLAGYAGVGYRAFYLEGPTLAALLSAEPEGEPDMAGRLADACRRIVAGLLLAMQSSPSNYKERRVEGRRGTPRERGEPGHRRVVVGAPVKIDARPVLDAFLRGERMEKARRRTGVGAIQWLVRGHWREVRHGKGRALRRPAWIEPFWSGRADAAISTRPKLVK